MIIAVDNDPYLIANQLTYHAIIAVLFVNIAVPAIMILMLYKLKLISGIDLKIRNERFFPYLFVIGFYIFSYTLFQYRSLPISSLLYAYFFGIIITLLLALVINFWWKISIHLLALGGVLGMWFALAQLHHLNLDLYLLIGILMAGLVGFARLLLKAHTPAQIYTGFVLGFFVQYFIVVNHLYIPIF